MNPDPWKTFLISSRLASGCLKLWDRILAKLRSMAQALHRCQWFRHTSEAFEAQPLQAAGFVVVIAGVINALLLFCRAEPILLWGMWGRLLLFLLGATLWLCPLQKEGFWERALVVRWIKRWLWRDSDRAPSGPSS